MEEFNKNVIMDVVTNILVSLLIREPGEEECTPAQIASFRKNVQEYLQKKKKDEEPFSFHIEHSPEGTLAWLCKKSGVMGLNFPTFSEISVDLRKEVVVRFKFKYENGKRIPQIHTGKVLYPVS